MAEFDCTVGVNRRSLLAAGAATLLSASRGAAQEFARGAASLSARVGDFAAAFDLAKAPAGLIERTRIACVDTVGVMLGGAHEEVARIARDMAAAEGSVARCTVAGSSLRASPQLAALANGVAAHAMDYDFTYASGQAVAPVIPALLALSEANNATPQEFIAAFVVGCEVAARLVRASPMVAAQGGWHAVGAVGPIAAAAACARLMKLPALEIAQAVGISASLASGLSVNFGTMTKPLHSGHAARSGVMAAQLAARGFTSSGLALEGKAGYFDILSRALPRVDGAFDDLGVVFDLMDRGYKIKRYPCGGLSHAAIDATLAIRERISGGPESISKIDVGVTKNAFQRIGAAYPHSVESAKFSMPYIAAWTTLHGAPTLAAFTDAAIEDVAVKAFAPKISHHVDSEFADEVIEAPGRVRVTLRSGEVLEEKVWFASGSVQNPMTPAQNEAKFRDCARLTLQDDPARRAFEWLSRLPQQTSFDALWPLLRTT